MKPTREQCLKWAEEVYGATHWSPSAIHHLEIICQRVWDEAIEAAMEASYWSEDTESIRKLKVKP